MSLGNTFSTLLDGDPAIRTYGLRVQRIVALSLAGLAFAAVGASSQPGFFVVTGVWLLLAGALPAVFGRIIATFIWVASAVAIMMGEGGGGVTFRPLVALGAAPFLLLAALLVSRAFAAAVGASVIHAFKSVFAPTP